MNSLSITSLTAAAGCVAFARVSGTVSGTLGFVASRVPDGDDPHTIGYASSADGSYRLMLPHDGLWYVWACDDDGQSGEAAAVWVGIAQDAILNVAGTALRDRLEANRAGIEAAMRAVDEQAVLRQVVYGAPTDVTDWPAILIAAGRLTDEYVGFPYLRELGIQFQVACIVLHQEDQSAVPLASRMAHAVMTILNQPAYDEIDAGEGVHLYTCRASSVEVNDWQVEDVTWAAEGRLSWSASLLIADGR